MWPVHTVHFSNHTGYGEWRGPLLPADDVRAVIRGVEERGAFPGVDAVLSGYQGGEDIGDVILDAVARVKAANPAAIYACDPVMGNAKSGCFVHPAIPVLLRERVVPAADLITPNQFELGFLTDTEPPRPSRRPWRRSSWPARWGPSTVLVTSVERPDAPEGTIEMMAVTGDGAWIVQTPRLPMKANGSGDVTAALFTAHLLETAGLARPSALGAHASSSVFDLLRTTQRLRAERELAARCQSPGRRSPHPDGCSSRSADPLSVGRSAPSAAQNLQVSPHRPTGRCERGQVVRDRGGSRGVATTGGRAALRARG